MLSFGTLCHKILLGLTGLKNDWAFTWITGISRVINIKKRWQEL